MKIQGPDLVAANLDINGLSFFVGERFDFILDISNIGGLHSGEFSVSFYITEDQGLDYGVHLFSEEGIPSLSPGERSLFDFSAYTDGSWYSGEYYLAAVIDSKEDVDEADETNNVIYKQIYLKGIEPAGDVAFSLYRSSTADQILERGGIFSTYFEVINSYLGQTDFGRSTSARIVFSTDQNVSGDDIFLGDFHIPDLSVGQREAFLEAEVLLPDNMPLGNYYVAIILDPDNLINEADEDNNTAWYSHTFKVVESGAPFDVSASNLKVSMRSDGSGIFDATFEISNHGPFLPDGTLVALRLTNDESIHGEEGYFVGFASTGELRSSESVSVEISEIDLDWVLADGTFNPGVHYFSVEADYNDRIVESDEQNNISNFVPFVLGRPVEAGSVFAETGTLALNHNAQTVTLQRSYEKPVVIAFVATKNGADPVNVRIGDVSANKLTLQLQEPNYLDGWHTNETVNYMVVEAGTWILPDGTILEAGTLNSNQLSSNRFESVVFDAEFDSAPVILSQVQTFNGGDFVTTRQRSADSDGFQLTMQKEEALNSGGHVTETLGWVAIEAGSGTAGDVSWLAGSTSGVTHANASVGIGASVAGGAKVIAALSSFAGADSAWVRGNGSSYDAFDVSVEEEASRDAETLHTAETVDYFVFKKAGTISAAPIHTFAETGTLTLNHNAQTVTLQRSYEKPVVIAFVATENGADPVNVRIGDVSANKLTLQLQEPNYLDGWHTNETVNYMVVEAGTWILPDGTILEAGTLNSNQLSSNRFESVVFDAEFDSAPVILSQVQTFNGGDFVTTRQRSADSDGFQLTMQKEEALNSGGHVTETLGWVAIEAGSGTAGDVSWLAGSTSGVTHANASVGIGASVAGGAKVIAALSSFAGADSAWVRGNGSSYDAFDVSVEEEASRDAETLHTAETVDYFVFNESGVIGAYDYDFFYDFF
ncbi:CARDB domain-containing protein [Pararhodobacter sp. SW119]|uniref:CARDB domain-containing protein n=1 Tax=Pararhodobacter sp. SW119 TaxID=2780075 RepID=UPI001ADFF912|nr:CARDB domain-containing protein [Pararhodobacter sp. SW119]